MKKEYQIKSAIVALSLFVFPLLVSAQTVGLGNNDTTGGPLGVLLSNILAFTNTVLIPFIIAIGFLVFVWGMFQFFILGGANDESKEKGKSLMIWATVGFVLIIIFWGIINLLTTSTGLDKDFKQDLAPKVQITPKTNNP